MSPTIVEAHVGFSADPVGVGIDIGILVGVGIASCLHFITLMNGWILAKHTAGVSAKWWQ